MKKPTALNYLLENAKRRKATYITIAVMSIFAVLAVFVMAERPGVTLTEDTSKNEAPNQAAVQQKADEIMPLADEGFPIVELDEDKNCKYTFNEDNSLVIEPINMGQPCIVTALQNRDFDGKSSVTSIKFKDGITKIESGTSSNNFASVCKSSLLNVDFSECTTITDLGAYSFDNCNNLCKDDTIDLSSCINLKEIPDYCFHELWYVKGIKLPKSIEVIGSYAFGVDGTNNGRKGIFISSINFNELENLRIIKSYAFRYTCASLPELDLTGCKNLEKIEKNAFEPLGTNSKAKKINLSGLDKLTTIETGAFSHQRACSEVDLSGCSSLKNIGSNAFYNVGNNSNYVTVDSIKFSFDGCNELTTLDLNSWFNSTKLGSVILSDTMTSIGNSSFFNNTKLREIGLKNVTSIDSNAFSGCSSLEDIDLRNVTTIGSSAFYGCSSLEDIDLSNVTSIGNSAFYGCTNLTDFSFLNEMTKVKKIAYNTFSNTGVKELDLNFPNIAFDTGVFSSCKDLAVVNYTAVKSIGSNTFNSSGDKKGIIVNITNDANKIADNFLTGTVKIKEFNFEGPNDSLILGKNSLSAVNDVLSRLCDGTTEYSVDEYGCLYSKDKSILYYVPPKLTTYRIPDTVKKINNHAFRYAKNLDSLTVVDPANIDLGEYAFTGCKTLKSINGKTTYAEAKALFKTASYTAFLQTGFEVSSEYSQKNEYIENNKGEGYLVNQTKIGENLEYRVNLSLDTTTKGNVLDSTKRYNSVDNSADKNNVDDKTHYYLTNEKATLNFSIDAQGATKNKFCRIYLETDRDDINIDSFEVGKVTTLTNEGKSYDITLKNLAGTNLYYFDFEIVHGDTFAAQIKMFYDNMTGSSNARIWSQIIDKDDLIQYMTDEEKTELYEIENSSIPENEKEVQRNEFLDNNADKYLDKLPIDSAPIGDSLKAHWYTAATKYRVSKSNQSSTLGFKYVEDGDSGSIRLNKDLIYRITTNKESTVSTDKTSFGLDSVEYMDFEDTLNLPDGIEWEQWVIDGIKNNKIEIKATSTRECSIYIDNTQIASLSVNTSNLRLSRVRVEVDESGDKPKITISWRLTNPNAYTGTDYSNGSYTTLTFKAQEVFKIADDYDFNVTHRVPNDVTQYPHYIYAEEENEVYPKELFKQEANTYAPINKVNRTINFDKSYVNYGTNGKRSDPERSYFYGGERVDFNISVDNPSILPYPVTKVEDTLPNAFIITPDKMDEMFENEETGKLLTITITNGYLDKFSQDYTVTNTDGGKTNLDTIDRGTSSELVSPIVIKWLDDVLTVTVGDEDKQVYTVGENEEYKSLEKLLKKIGFIDKNETFYKCEWSYPDDQNGNVKMFRPNESQTFVIPAEVKTTFEKINKDMYIYIYNQTTKNYEDINANRANLYSDHTSIVNENDTVGGFRWYYDYYINKDLSYNGTTITDKNGHLITANAVVDYVLSFSHRGNSEESAVPLNDVMSGNQVLLVPVTGNDSLADLNLEKVQSGGVWYYLLDKPGTYEKVRIGVDNGKNIIADRVIISGSKPSITTRIYWYYDSVNGTSSHTIKYKAKLFDDFSKVDDEGNKEQYFTVSNRDYLNERSEDRLYDEIGLRFKDLYFEKNIVKIDDDGNEVLLKDSEIAEGDSVLYKIRVVNNSSGDNYINDIRDELPQTFGTFAWSKENVSVRYVSSIKKPDAVELEGNNNPKFDRSEDVWRITDTPKDGSDKINGQYYIYWDKDNTDQSKIPLEAYEVLDIYVTLTYPPPGDVWNNFMIEALESSDGNSSADGIISNTCRAGSQNSNVQHSIKTTGEVVLQKGVYDTYFNNRNNTMVYPILNRNTYTNSLDNKRYVLYYVTLYNSGYSRMYLTDLYDNLPKGFTFTGVASTKSSNIVDNTSITTYGIANANNQNTNYLNNLLARVEDNNSKQPVNYKSVNVSSSVVNGQLKFSFSQANSGENKINYDSNEGKCYLEKGEAIVFGYYARVGKNTETEDIANNSIAMKYYDYNQAGFSKSKNINIYGNYTQNPSDTNDGKQNLLTSEEAGNLGYRNDSINGSDWLESNVSLSRGKIIPGVEKKIKYEYTNNNSTKDIDSQNGVLVDPTSTIGWEVKLHNTGTKNINGYKVTETMEGPYVFDSDVSFGIYDSKANATMSNNIIQNVTYNTDNSSEHKDTISFKTNSNNSYTVPVNMETMGSNGLGEITTDYSQDCEFTWNGRSNKFNIKFTRYLNENSQPTGNLKMEITFAEVTDVGIPAGGYAVLNLKTKSSINGYSFKRHVNDVKFTPFENFEQEAVTIGASADEGKSVEASAFFAIAGTWATESYKTVTSINSYGETQKATSAHSNKTPNYITIDYDRETDSYKPFNYGLDVKNLCTAKQIHKLVIIDNLPEPGDHSAYADRIERNSAFKVVLGSTDITASLIESGEGASAKPIIKDPTDLSQLGYNVEFTTATEFTDDDWSGNEGSVKWYTEEQVLNGTDGITLDDIRSFRVIISGGNGISPGETVNINVPGKIDGTPTAYLIAWNNFGYKYYAENDNSSEDKVLTASTLNVGIRTAAVPKIKKVLNSNSGTPISAKEYNLKATFLVYKGEKLSYSDEQELLSQLKEQNIPFTVQEVNGDYIDSQKEIDMMKLFNYEVVNGEDGKLSYQLTDNKWIWEEDSRYTFTEINLPPNVKFTLYIDNNGSTIKSNSMTITFKQAGYYSMTCQNTYNDYELDIEKTSSKTNEGLKGAVFARYGVANVEVGSDEYKELCQKSITAYEKFVEEFSKESYEPNRKLEFLSKSKLDLENVDYAVKVINDPYGTSKVLDIGNEFYPVYVVKSGDEQKVYYFMDYETTNEDGKIIYNNCIDNGFAFVEAVAPVGYETENKIHILTREEDSSKETIRVSDVPITELPMTGGSGYLILLIGAVFITLPTIGIIINAKRKGGKTS